MYLKNFPEKIKKLRLAHNLTQSDLADLLHTTKQAISSYESGKATPSLNALIRISEYFNVSLDSLVFDSNSSSINLTNNKVDLVVELLNIQYKINNLLTSLEEDDLNYINKNTKEDTENFNEEYADELVPNITDITSYRKTKDEIVEDTEEEIEYRHIIDRGCIPAGKLRETFADDFGAFEVPENKLSRKKDYYILTISGDSMDKYYPDGEKILVENTEDVTYGDIVIARVSDSATVKKLSKHEKGIELVPLSNNPEHKPQIITDEDFCIKGKVLGLLSEFLD